MPKILVVDDRANMLRLMEKVLRQDAEVLAAESGHEALAMLESHAFSAVICDLRMPDMSGIDVLRACKRLRPSAEFVLMTAYASVPTAIEATREGAFDYLIKPFEPEALRAVVGRALGRASGGESAQAELFEDIPGLVGRSAVMQQLGAQVRRISASDATVLILGETGTGKERIARALHVKSARARERMVAVNCAAIPLDLLESELFGYARGAFTGATRDRAGLFEEADLGTLFLDEIGEMRMSLQAKLTRAIEERSIRRLGESKERRVNARLVAATHRDLESMVRTNTFREDLWYRLNVAVVRVPPLRERRDDIELLALHFLAGVASNNPNGRGAGFTDAAVRAMTAYDWPGNVRQLRSAVERASLEAGDSMLDVKHLPPEVLANKSRDSDCALLHLTWQDAIERGRHEAGRRYLQAVVAHYGGRVAEAAQHAKVERESFYRLLRKYDVRINRNPSSHEE